MEKMDKNRWVDEVMKSTDGMQRAMPTEHLFAKIEARVNKSITYVKTVPMRTVLAAAASLALLVSVNVYILDKINTTPPTNDTKDEMETVIEYYGLNNTSNIYL